MSRRGRFVGAALALAVAGCASSPDYSYMRESRFDRPYRGGAANVPDSRPEPERRPMSDGETVGWLAYLGAIGAAIAGHASWSFQTPTSPPPR